MSNRLVELMNLGQSVWFDNIHRALIESGELKRMVEDDDLRGVTSNPTIFEKAITGSKDYDRQLNELIAAGASVNEIYEALVIDDISRAADILKPVYDRTNAVDGYISLEVNPRLAYETSATIDEASRLFKRLGRKNVMIKIPASREGIPAIEESIYRGVNINITMIFSIENYEQVAEAYIRGLERRAAEGKPVDKIASVASFFVSRVDTLVDKELDKLAEKAPTDERRQYLLSLKGRAALANAKIAYQHYKAIFHGGRFDDLLNLGAMVQRPLWASTGTKNPQYPDLLYVDNLIGQETVNTVPPATYKAFKDHGVPALSIEEDLAESRELIAQLEKAGISLKRVTDQLQVEGLDAFVKSFDSLEQAIETRLLQAKPTRSDGFQAMLGNLEPAVASTIAEAEKDQIVRRIWEKDATVWTDKPDQQKVISNALGWLNVATAMRSSLGELKAFSEVIRSSGNFKHVMVCGMGGSSLCPEVLRQTFGPQQGYPELLVLDSTDPDQIAAFKNRIEVDKCLFIIASKSGTTTEPTSFYKYWFAEVAKVSKSPGANFVAITDPGTSLEKLAADKGFRKTFLNPADIGGRYSALSYFGLVPAALMGIDVGKLLDKAESAMQACSAKIPDCNNPGLRLGAILGAGANAKRDKLTLTGDQRLVSLGLWIEQLIAESTGKDGKGIIPVVAEPLAGPEAYGQDRLFVNLSMADSVIPSELKAIESAGHPVVYLTINDLYDLGAEFFIWEFATAVAGWRLGINPFDQPNVQEAKDATKALLEKFKAAGRFDEQPPAASEGALKIFNPAYEGKQASFEGVLAALFKGSKEGDYIALLNFIEETPEHESAIEMIRAELRNTTRLATTAGYGPRYLHSTGQLHKGGPANGIFLQLTAPNHTDLPIPGEPYGFSILEEAQALGDLESLLRRGRRAVRIDLGDDSSKGLQDLLRVLKKISTQLRQRFSAENAVTSVA
jgi:transaldolase/glucose-6-phosphate isomerase